MTCARLALLAPQADEKFLRTVGADGWLRLAPARQTGRSAGFHNVFCVWPHSLQVYSPRVWPTGILTRFGAPHLPHFSSRRPSTFVIETDLLCSASAIRRCKVNRSRSRRS